MSQSEKSEAWSYQLGQSLSLNITHELHSKIRMKLLIQTVDAFFKKNQERKAGLSSYFESVQPYQRIAESHVYCVLL